MKLLLLILTAFILSGCAVSKLPPSEPTIIVKTEYIVKIPPKELLDVAPAPTIADIDKATQAAIAQWIIDNEAYINSLRNQLVAIAKFLKNEQDKADDVKK